MKFVLKQEKFEDMLEKLMVKDILPKSILVAKGKEIMSVQKEEHARAFRFLKLKEDYFESIDEVEDEEYIEFDVKKLNSIIKKLHGNSDVTMKTKEDKIEISAKNRTFGIAIVEPEDVKQKLPFTIGKDGAPAWDEESLDTHFTIKTEELKDASDYASSLSTEFFQFIIDKKDVSIRVGDIHDFTEYAILDLPTEKENEDDDDDEIKAEIKKGKELTVSFTFAVPQIADTFREKVNIWARTDMPAWFYEKTDEYFLGVLVPPYTEEEE